jgi:transcriptional regulator with XRE-family HTH domain
VSEPRSAPTVGQVVLGKRLQDLRERVGLSREQAAKVLRVAPATIRRMETAEVALKIPYVQALLKAYGIAEAETDAFVDLTEEANKPGWWQRFHDVLPDWFSMYVSLEGAASLLRMYEPHFVPGLLQTGTTRAPSCAPERSARPGPRTSNAMWPCGWSGSPCSPGRTPRSCGS